MQKKTRDPHKKRLNIVLVAIVAAFAAWLLFSPYGAWRYFRIERDMQSVLADNARLRDENKKLASEIYRLQNDPVFVEEVARKEYGLIKKNELLFEFGEEKSKK